MSDDEKQHKSKKHSKSQSDELINEAEYLDREAAKARQYHRPNFGISNTETELELGKRLQLHRESKKLTQGQLAELTKEADPLKIGISRAVISMYEVGKNRPSPKEIRMLCEALKISPNYLIYGDEDPFDNLGDKHRWGYYSSSDPEFNALFIYTFHKLHHHHKLAILQIINGLLLGTGEGAIESHSDAANSYLIELANELKSLTIKKS